MCVHTHNLCVTYWLFEQLWVQPDSVLTGQPMSRGVEAFTPATTHAATRVHSSPSSLHQVCWRIFLYDTWNTLSRNWFSRQTGTPAGRVSLMGRPSHTPHILFYVYISSGNPGTKSPSTFIRSMSSDNNNNNKKKLHKKREKKAVQQFHQIPTTANNRSMFPSVGCAEWPLGV